MKRDPALADISDKQNRHDQTQQKAPFLIREVEDGKLAHRRAEAGEGWVGLIGAD